MIHVLGAISSGNARDVELVFNNGELNNVRIQDVRGYH